MHPNVTSLPPLEQFLGHVLALYGSGAGCGSAAPSTTRSSGGVPWPEFCQELLALYQSSRARLTHQKMRQVLREVGALPDVRTVHDLTPATVARFKDSCLARGRSPRTTATLLGYLRAACRYAVARGLIYASPFTAWPDWGLEAEPEPDGSTPPPRHLGLAEVGRVLAHLAARADRWDGGRLHALASLVAYTGLRKMEALTLMARDVDLFAQVVTVRKRRRLKRPSAAAPVPMPPALVPVLEAWLLRCDSPWLFPNRGRTGPWTSGSPASRPLAQLSAAGRAVGVPGLTFQALRHSWATHAETAWGLSELAIQRVLRHTTTRTQAHYRHADLANLRQVVAGVRYPTD